MISTLRAADCHRNAGVLPPDGFASQDTAPGYSEHSRVGVASADRVHTSLGVLGVLQSSGTARVRERNLLPHVLLLLELCHEHELRLPYSARGTPPTC
jgi:hypothetical protein